MEQELWSIYLKSRLTLAVSRNSVQATPRPKIQVPQFASLLPFSEELLVIYSALISSTPDTRHKNEADPGPGPLSLLSCA